MPLFLTALRRVRRLHHFRELALICLALTIVLVGAALFSLTQSISFGTALYWAVTTATTVGYGDVTPHNTAGRVIASVVMLTTIPTVAAVFALYASASVLARIRRLLGMETPPPTSAFTAVYGSHPIVPRVLDELRRSGHEVLLVAPAKPAGCPDEIHFMAGDPTDAALIRHSDPARAERALIACTSDADTLVIAVMIHGLAPQLEVFALTQAPAVASALRELGVSHALAGDELLGHTVAKSLETPTAGKLLLQLVDTERYRLVEAEIGAELVSQRLSQARGRAGTLVLAIARHDGIDLGVHDDPVLAAGDRLIAVEPLEAGAGRGPGHGAASAKA
jgi:voltage-gated potassium channel